MSMSENRIAIREATAVEQYSDDALTKVIEAVTRGDLPVETMERLVALSERMMENRRKQAFAEAMARLQAKLPQITKEGRIVVKGTERSRYARLEDIDIAIRPLLAEEGFSFSFDSDSSDAKLFKLSAKLSHREGHSETKFLTLPIDASDYRSSVQSIGSTVSYGKRQLIKMHLNLIERDEDSDGTNPAFISEEHLRDIETGLADTKSNVPAFLKHFGIADLKELPEREYGAAMQAIATKRRGMK